MTQQETLAESIARATTSLEAAERTLDNPPRLAEHLKNARFAVDVGLAMLGEEAHDMSPMPSRSNRARGGRRANRIDGKAFHAAIVEILNEHGTAMSVRELMDELQRCNVSLPGQGRQANVIGHLTRIPEVERSNYGRYRLKRARRSASKKKVNK